MEKTIIDINELKKKLRVDSLPYHLWYIALDCKNRRDAFWRHYKALKIKNNLVSIPLLLLTSVTGLTSVANLGNEYTGALPITVSVFGVSSAVLTALQRYFRYSERAEHSKHLAKTYGRIARRIENMMVLVESSAITMQPEAFIKFVEDVQKDTDSLLQEINDIPSDLVHDKRWYEELFVKMKKKPMIGISDDNETEEVQSIELKELQHNTRLCQKVISKSIDTI